MNKSHYNFKQYMTPERWASYWCQINELNKIGLSDVLEVGPGSGVLKAVCATIGIKVNTIDVDPDLKADYTGSVLDLPFADEVYGVVCAFQVLEHMPFKASLEAFGEMSRVAKSFVIVSLPDAAVRWPISIHIPKKGRFVFSVPKVRLYAEEHRFNGEHYWELNKKGYGVGFVVESFVRSSGLKLVDMYRVPENPKHRFMVFKK